MRTKKTAKPYKKQTKKKLPEIDLGASIPILSSMEKRKRCPNGSRFDKIAEQCMKFSKIKVFNELAEQEISEKGTTVSIESLNKDGAIIKLYRDGSIVEQKYVSEEGLEKAKEKGKKDIQKIIKNARRIAREPWRIEKDKEYQKLQRKMRRELSKRKGGGQEEEQSAPIDTEKTNIMIQADVMDKLKDTAIEKAQEKLPADDSLASQWYNGGMAIFNLLGSLIYTKLVTFETATTSSVEEISKWLHNISTHHKWYSKTIISNLSNAVSKYHGVNIFGFEFDMIGLLVLTVINIVAMIYPGDNMDIFINITQYVIYTSCLLFGGPLFTIGNWWIYSGLALTVIKSVFIGIKHTGSTEEGQSSTEENVVIEALEKA